LKSDALTPVPPDGPEVMRSRVVSVDFDRLDAPRDAVAATGVGPLQLVLNLFDDATFTARVDEVSPTATAGGVNGLGLAAPEQHQYLHQHVHFTREQLNRMTDDQLDRTEVAYGEIVALEQGVAAAEAQRASVSARAAASIS